jgi:hypothetical protein
MIARSAMAPAAPMQREAVGRTFKAVLAILAVRAIRTLTLLRLLLVRLAAGNE